MRVALDAVQRTVTAGRADWISATAPRRQKLLAKAPHGRRWTLTFLPALRCGRTDTLSVIGETSTGESFLSPVKEIPAPPLKPVDIVIINPGSHVSLSVRRAILATGAKLCLGPPQCPNQNPLVRTAAQLSVAAARKRIGAPRSTFAPLERADRVRNA
jgi:hypothetical protein